MFTVQGSTLTPDGRNVYGCGNAAAGQTAAYVATTGEIASAKIVAVKRTQGAWMGPDVLVLDAAAAAPAAGCDLRIDDAPATDSAVPSAA